jgi:hypothetical protein
MGMQVIQILTQFLIMQNILGIFETIAQLWTTNGKILMKDKDNRIYETNTMDALAEVIRRKYRIIKNLEFPFVCIDIMITYIKLTINNM